MSILKAPQILVTLSMAMLICLNLFGQNEFKMDPCVDRIWVIQKFMTPCSNCYEYYFKKIASESEAYNGPYAGGFIFNSNGTYREIGQSMCGLSHPKPLQTGTWKVKSRTIYLYEATDTNRLTDFRIYVRMVNDSTMRAQFIQNK